MTRSALFGCSAYEIGKPVLRPTVLASFLFLALSFNAPIACAVATARDLLVTAMAAVLI